MHFCPTGIVWAPLVYTDETKSNQVPEGEEIDHGISMSWARPSQNQGLYFPSKPEGNIYFWGKMRSCMPGKFITNALFVCVWNRGLTPGALNH